jgi:biotin carboxylase
MTTALVLGAGIMQGPSLRIARRMGWRTVAADANPEAPCRSLADRFALVDLKDRKGMLALARSLKEGEGLDAVFTAGTDFSTTVSYVCERLGLPCVPLAAAERATDKHLMRRALRDAGVPCPGFAEYDGKGDPADAARGLSLPLVVKPADSMGSRAVRRVDAIEELPVACRDAMAVSRSGRAVIEEHMDGPELSLDAIVWRGQATVCGVADRIIRFPPYFVEMGHTMWTELCDAERRSVEGVFRDGIRALGIDNGAAKGDIKLTSRGPMVGEIAARLSGGYMSGWTFPLASGVEVTGAALRVAAGLEPGDLSPKRRWTSAERAFISIPGIVKSIEGVEEAKSTAGVHEVFVLTGTGRRTVFPTSNVEKAGNVIAAHESRQRAVAAAEAAAALILVRLEPGDERTDAFLFGDPSGCPHPAFSLERVDDRSALKAMPAFLGDASAVRAVVPIEVLALPGMEDEPSRDWHGRSLREAVGQLAARGIIRLVTVSSACAFALGSVFWRAFLRGSVQAGAYVVDSLAGGTEMLHR